MAVARALLILSLVLPFIAALGICRRRAVWRLGREGRALAPAFLLSLWFLGLAAGQFTGSLMLMAWVAAAPVLGLAVVGWRNHRPIVRHHGRWTALDAIVFLFLVACVLAVVGGDNLCHYAVVSTYLRGNIPPRAFNDPSFPLVYHGLFDAAAAVVVRAFRIDLEAGLDVVTVVCLAATVSALGALSRTLFASPAARQAARVFFLLGFGPTWARVVAGAPVSSLHGDVVQPVADLVLRRPMALNLVLFTFALGALFPRLRAPDRPGARFGPKSCYLLPLPALLPLVSEELVAILILLGSLLVLRRRLSLRALLFAGSIAAVVALGSGVLRGVAAQESPMAIPKPRLAFPPTLPAWSAPHEGLPLLSHQASERLLLELGPLALGAFVLAVVAGDDRRRVLVLLALGGAAAGCLFGLRGWPKADLDRFLFYGALSGYLLAADWIERLGRVRQAAVRRTLGASICLSTIAAPVAVVSQRLLDQRRPTLFIAHERPGDDLRRALAAVGPRETILTDLASAQFLVSAGFLVIAPMTSHMVAKVVAAEFSTYVARHEHRADWLFVPLDDARVAGKPIAAEHAGYVLVRAR
jgi:hypothetical protein